MKKTIFSSGAYLAYELNDNTIALLKVDDANAEQYYDRYADYFVFDKKEWEEILKSDDVSAVIDYETSFGSHGADNHDRFTYPDGSYIIIESLGRDHGNLLHGYDKDDEKIFEICLDFAKYTASGMYELDNDHDDALSAADAIDDWENGMGGSPFDQEYWSE